MFKVQEVRSEVPFPIPATPKNDSLPVKPDECPVVEDAEAGINTALVGRMKTLAIDSAAKDKSTPLRC
jgi:beta-phosphoglucomutase-like phosphatase (HAD superfamily)